VSGTTRWEWRTFGDEFGDVEAAAATLAPAAVQETDEVYLLAAGGQNVKVRDEMLDIKVLREVDRVGLQRWEPVLKARFPLSRDDVAAGFVNLHRPVPTLEREVYTLEQFLSELLEPTSGVRAVPVHKRRVRYEVRGCMAELSDVTAGGRSTRTIAIETPDPAALWATVKEAGLHEAVNRSVPEGLMALVDATPQRVAVIDCGTNSIKFHVAEREGSGWRTVVDRAEITRLGEGLTPGGRISGARSTGRSRPSTRWCRRLAGCTCGP
jgi:exopolyphosphatase / guanosine-5'-triphosphate,3'-diphosphate pyrophosphatase